MVCAIFGGAPLHPVMAPTPPLPWRKRLHRKGIHSLQPSLEGRDTGSAAARDLSSTTSTCSPSSFDTPCPSPDRRACGDQHTTWARANAHLRKKAACRMSLSYTAPRTPCDCRLKSPAPPAQQGKRGAGRGGGGRRGAPPRLGTMMGRRLASTRKAQQRLTLLGCTPLGARAVLRQATGSPSTRCRVNDKYARAPGRGGQEEEERSQRIAHSADK
jgi:hypothetical protein